MSEQSPYCVTPEPCDCGSCEQEARRAYTNLVDALIEPSAVTDPGHPHGHDTPQTESVSDEAGDTVVDISMEQALEKDATEIEADITAGRVERFDSMYEAIQALRDTQRDLDKRERPEQ